MLTSSLRTTLQVPNFKDPWGPYYFNRIETGKLVVYTESDTQLLPIEWPAYGYMVSDNNIKRSIIHAKIINASLVKLSLLETKLDKYESSFNSLYEYNIVLEQENKSWKWASAGEGVSILLLLVLLAVL